MSSQAAAPLLAPAEVAAPRSKNFPLWPLRHVNHNVGLVWFAVVVECLAMSCWSGTVLNAFLYELSGSNYFVGLVSGAMGLVQLIGAYPIGWLADKHGKAQFVKLGGVLTPLAVGVCSYAAVYGVGHDAPSQRMGSFWMMFGGMCLFGLVFLSAAGPLQSLYADSIATGERSWCYAVLNILAQVGSAGGPVVAIVMFAVKGNQWDLPSLRDVFLVGMGIELLFSFFLWHFRDDCAIGAETLAPPPAASSAASSAASADAPPAAAAVSSTDGAASPSQPAGGDESETWRPPSDSPHAWMVPWVMFASTLVEAVGGGLTASFFPLFWKNDIGFTPAVTQSIFLVSSLLSALTTALSTRLASKIGRAETILLTNFFGAALLLSLALLRDNTREDHPAASWHAWHAAREAVVQAEAAPSLPPGLPLTPAPPPTAPPNSPGSEALRVGIAAGLVAIYLASSSLQACNYPLCESISMDFVPSNTRARWKSLDSIGRFGWAGSSVLGGWIADQRGYTFTFAVTAAASFVAIAMRLRLLGVVPRNEKPKAQPEGLPEPECAGDGKGSIQAPQAA